MRNSFKSKCFEDLILKKLEKESIQKITESDLSVIDNLEIIKNNKKQDYNLIDLQNFSNLRSICLVNFKINNFETNILNRCKNLEEVEFRNCKIISKSRLLNENIKFLIIENCKNINSRYFSKIRNVKKLKVSNIRKFDARKTARLVELENLTINNVKIKASKYLAKIVKLTYLNLRGSRFDKSLENYLSSNVIFEK